MNSIFEPHALRLHSHCLRLIHDPEWSGLPLYEHLERFAHGRESKQLFFKTVQDGVLFEIVQLAHSHYFDFVRIEQELSVEEALWFADDLCALLKFHKITDRVFTGGVTKLANASNRAFERQDDDHDHYTRWLERQGVRIYDYLQAKLCDGLDWPAPLAHAYATATAERILHDRSLCGYISFRIHAIGIDGGLDADDESPKQWVERVPIPSWAKKMLLARERGCCAVCAKQLSLELLDDPHVDHILPLKLGGTNDICNLQVLCSVCNLAKGARRLEARSSVPAYLRQLKSAASRNVD